MNLIHVKYTVLMLGGILVWFSASAQTNLDTAKQIVPWPKREKYWSAELSGLKMPDKADEFLDTVKTMSQSGVIVVAFYEGQSEPSFVTLLNQRLSKLHKAGSLVASISLGTADYPETFKLLKSITNGPGVQPQKTLPYVQLWYGRELFVTVEKSQGKGAFNQLLIDVRFLARPLPIKKGKIETDKHPSPDEIAYQQRKRMVDEYVGVLYRKADWNDFRANALRTTSQTRWINAHMDLAEERLNDPVLWLNGVDLLIDLFEKSFLPSSENANQTHSNTNR